MPLNKRQVLQKSASNGLTCSADALGNLPAAGQDVMQALTCSQSHPHSPAVAPAV